MNVINIFIFIISIMGLITAISSYKIVASLTSCTSEVNTIRSQAKVLMIIGTILLSVGVGVLMCAFRGKTCTIDSSTTIAFGISIISFILGTISLAIISILSSNIKKVCDAKDSAGFITATQVSSIAVMLFSIGYFSWTMYQRRLDISDRSAESIRDEETTKLQVGRNRQKRDIDKVIAEKQRKKQEVVEKASVFTNRGRTVPLKLEEQIALYDQELDTLNERRGKIDNDSSNRSLSSSNRFGRL